MTSLRVENRDGVAVFTLDRPHRLNALSEELLRTFAEALEAAAGDGAIRAVVITGAGRAFCAGGDVYELAGRQPGEPFLRFMGLAKRWLTALAEHPKPVVAAVNGTVAGIGVSLVAATDWVVCSRDASIHLGFLHLGFVPDTGVSWLLPRQIGLRRARALLLAGGRLSADEARQEGLVDEVVEPPEVLARAEGVARQLGARPSLAVAMTKRLLLRALESDLAGQMEAEAQAQALCFAEPSAQALLQGFVHKSGAASERPA